MQSGDKPLCRGELRTNNRELLMQEKQNDKMQKMHARLEPLSKERMLKLLERVIRKRGSNH